MQIKKLQNINYNNTFGMKYPITKTKNVSPDFIKKVEHCLDSLPDEWQEPLQKNRYKLFCSNSIQDTFDHLSIPDQAPDWDAVTSAHPIFPFFVFTPKILHKDLQRVVNHEISHGIVNSEKLAERFDYLREIFKDTKKFPTKEPDYNNFYDINNLLIKPLDDYRINEVFADTLAWMQKGGGLWGSGYKGSKENHNFLKENYPFTHAKFKQFSPNQQIESPRYSYDCSDEMPF